MRAFLCRCKDICDDSAAPSPPAIPRAKESNAVRIVVFSVIGVNREKNDPLHGAPAAAPRQRGGGKMGGSTLLSSRRHLPREAPQFPYLNEARHTHTIPVRGAACTRVH